MAGGAAEVLSVSLNCPLPLQRTHPPTLVCCFCVFAAMGVISTKSGRLEVNLSLSGKRGWEEPFRNYSTFSCFRNLEILHGHPFVAAYVYGMETTHDPKEPVLLIALRIMRHAMLCLSVIMFLICVCWHPERMCRALSTCGQRGQV